MHHNLDRDSETFIDALRGLAAVGVLLTHAVDLGIAGVYGRDMLATPESWRWIRASLGHGGFMVWCFFVISGLCIHRSIARGVEAGTFSWSRYFAARVSRIYPLFLLGLLLAVAVWWFTDALSGEAPVQPWRQFFASLVSLQILTSNFPTYDPSWSLSNEMIYYFVWPLAWIFLAGRNSRKALAFSMTATFLVAAGILILWKVFYRFEDSTFVQGMWTISILFPLWLCGAWLGTDWNSMRMRINRRLWLCSIPLCVVSAWLLVVLKFEDKPAWITDMAGLSSIPGLVLFFAGAHHARLGSSEWTRRVSAWLGQFSYPSYVLHFQLMILVDRLWLRKLSDDSAAGPVLRSLILFVPVSILLAMTGPWMEKRTMAWRAGMLARMPGGRVPLRSSLS